MKNYEKVTYFKPFADKKQNASHKSYRYHFYSFIMTECRKYFITGGNYKNYIENL